MAEKEGEEDKMESKLSSICGQNILTIEIYPFDIKCPDFSSEFSDSNHTQDTRLVPHELVAERAFFLL
eukprot:7026032-Ditylum_brightwellii.AAC.1